MVADTLNERTTTASNGEESTTSNTKTSCNSKRLSIQLFMNHFTLERFRKNPDIYRKRVFEIVRNQIRSASVTLECIRSIEPELRQLERQLGFLNIKCRTNYERFAFNRELHNHAEQILGNFDLSVEKTIDEVVSEAPSLLKNAVRLYQTRWRNAMATSRWQQDIDKAMKDMATIRERYKRYESELEVKRIQIEMCKKIRDIKADFDGLSDKEKLEKMGSVVREFLPLLPTKQEHGGVSLTRSASSNSLTSVSSDDTCWDDFI